MISLSLSLSLSLPPSLPPPPPKQKRSLASKLSGYIPNQSNATTSTSALLSTLADEDSTCAGRGSPDGCTKEGETHQSSIEGGVIMTVNSDATKLRSLTSAKLKNLRFLVPVVPRLINI